jgi:TonB family protein
MFVRTVCLFFTFALSATLPAQEGKRPLFAAPKPKVVATPAPTPVPAKPAARKRPAKPADPLAAYMPTVKSAFSLRWGETITPLLKDFNPGNVSVVFKLDAEGKVTDFTVTQNTSNEAFAKFCEQFVRETAFEQPPEKSLVDGQVEIPFTFSIY